MKRLNFLIGVTFTLVAIAGAFTASAAIVTVQVYYIDANSNCVQGTVEELECPEIGIPDCELPIIELGGAVKQVWAGIAPHPTQPNKFICTQPYGHI